MIEIDIPGYKTLILKHLVMDVNGTIALDGSLLVGVHRRLTRLRPHIKLHMLTADTHGKQNAIDATLDFKAHIITHGAPEKAEYVEKLGSEHVVTVGNGANDVPMCEAAALSIAVLGPEGVAGQLLRVADVVVGNINEGLELLLQPQRLRATLRR